MRATVARVHTYFHGPDSRVLPCGCVTLANMVWPSDSFGSR